MGFEDFKKTKASHEAKVKSCSMGGKTEAVPRNSGASGKSKVMALGQTRAAWHLGSWSPGCTTRLGVRSEYVSLAGVQSRALP